MKTMPELIEIIKIDGELNFDTVPKINRRGCIFIKKSVAPVFDLSFISSSDNSGVALLISWSRYAKSLNKKASFINLPKQLLALVEASGLKEFL